MQFLRSPLIQRSALRLTQIRHASALSANTINIIKATSPVVAQYGYQITSTMYGTMLKSDPAISALFNPSHQKVLPGEKVARQPSALAAAVGAYAANIDNLGVLTAAVERMAQKHVSLYILPEHYPVVGEHLLAAIKTVLGDAATPEIVQAWGEAYWFLADILIERERNIRESKASEVGGWEGWREFVVAKKVVESSEITSFYLRPKDGGKVVPFQAGQYLGLRFDTPEFTTQRNYSISNAPNDQEYRITVKRQAPAGSGCPVGQVSTFLHDQIKEGSVVKVGVPCGDFYLEVHHDKPIVLISGGVGITPIASMVEDLLQKKLPNSITMLNVTRNPEVEAMHEVFVNHEKNNSNFKVKTLYGEYPQTVVDAALLEKILDSKDAHYYFCGPPGFMRTIEHVLQDWKIPGEQIHFEYFGPHQ
ncbi:Nitric oxide dioxygenase (Pi-NOD1) [Thraustotheca clavata]|uniref:nitric oxide dioxygenase n=1 Tax=Thraustotheca clavata TaxID=74557 RepID=A0A1V9ZYV5_9STRA|nr:Nitric oxide dioxygenase (Pi-NOD1) [Thraustotheca clavata]